MYVASSQRAYLFLTSRAVTVTAAWFGLSLQARQIALRWTRRLLSDLAEWLTYNLSTMFYDPRLPFSKVC